MRDLEVSISSLEAMYAASRDCRIDSDGFLVLFSSAFFDFVAIIEWMKKFTSADHADKNCPSLGTLRLEIEGACEWGENGSKFISMAFRLLHFTYPFR